jgi:hypothetical protein
METMHHLLLTTPALAQVTGVQLGLFGRGNQTGYLLIALMLAFLLLSRVHRRGAQERVQPPPPRRNPVTYEELARIIYQIAVDCDLESYRGLFLAGAEAATVFGEKVGEAYLTSRTLEVLEESLVTIGAHLAESPRFHGVRLDTDDRLHMQVRRADGRLSEIDLGSVVRVGAVVRLAEPPYREH